MPNFQQLQWQLTRYLRDPESQPCPEEYPPPRAQLYRCLLFNNIQSVMENMFPVLHRVLSQDCWRTLLYEFYATHQAKKHRFIDIPEEFIDYLKNEHQPALYPPFLYELAHYEWTEIALMIHQSPSPPPAQLSTTQLLSQPLHWSDTAWLVGYQYPVHRISNDFLPIQPDELINYLMIYRNHEFDVKFLQLSAASAQCVQQLLQQPQLTGQEVVTSLAGEMPHIEKQKIQEGVTTTLEQLNQLGVLIGCRT